MDLDTGPGETLANSWRESAALFLGDTERRYSNVGWGCSTMGFTYLRIFPPSNLFWRASIVLLRSSVISASESFPTSFFRAARYAVSSAFSADTSTSGLTACLDRSVPGGISRTFVGNANREEPVYGISCRDVCHSAGYLSNDNCAFVLLKCPGDSFRS